MWQQIVGESNVNFKNPDTHESNADNTGIRATQLSGIETFANPNKTTLDYNPCCYCWTFSQKVVTDTVRRKGEGFG